MTPVLPIPREWVESHVAVSTFPSLYVLVLSVTDTCAAYPWGVGGVARGCFYLPLSLRISTLCH